MKYNKTLAVSFAAIAVIIAGSLAANAATSGSFQKFGFNKGQNQENHQEMVDAIESGSYGAWVEAVGSDSSQATEVTEAEFPVLIEAHRLAQEGRSKLEEAKELRTSIGLTRGNIGEGHMKGFDKGNKENRQAVLDALETGDYDAWMEIMGDNKVTENMTEDKFEKMIEAHEAMQSGDFERAKEIKDEIGFFGGPGNKMGHKGMNRNQQ